MQEKKAGGKGKKRAAKEEDKVEEQGAAKRRVGLAGDASALADLIASQYGPQGAGRGAGVTLTVGNNVVVVGGEDEGAVGGGKGGGVYTGLRRSVRPTRSQEELEDDMHR